MWYHFNWIHAYQINMGRKFKYLSKTAQCIVHLIISCPWKNGQPEAGVLERVNSPLSAQVVLGDFIDFHIHLPTFLWQLRCFVERIIRKRLSDSFIHSSAIARLSANSSCVSHQGQRLSDCPVAVQFVIVVSFWEWILKLTSVVQDWIALSTSESKAVILVSLSSSAVLIRLLDFQN